MNHLKIAATMVLAVLATAAVAQSSTPLAPSARSADPFAPVVGRWTTNAARFVSTAASPDYAGMNSTWTGKMYGVVKPSGQIVFKADNGCVLYGLASPFASNGLWAINAQLESCQQAHFNQKVFGNIRREGSELIMDFGEVPFAVGRPPLAYTMQMRMTSY